MTPSLFEKNRAGKALPVYNMEALYPRADWKATEMVDGVRVRCTVRCGTLVRTEVQQSPNRQQRQAGIMKHWYRDVIDSANSADYWVVAAVASIDYQAFPDGEWEGVAVGPKLKGNRYELYSSQVLFDSLLPWKDSLANTIPMPSVFRCPVEFEELTDWFAAKGSLLNPDVPIYGVTWWLYDEPVAQALRKEFDGEEG